MALKLMSGLQTKVHPTAETEFGIDGMSAGAALTTTETTIKLNGDSSCACPGTAANTSYRAWTFTAPSAGTTLYACGAFSVSVLPSATKKIISFGTASYVSGRLNADGTVVLYNDATGVQIGSTSQLVVATGAWYFIELALRIGTAATDYTGLRVFSNDAPALGILPELVAESDNFSLSDTQPTRINFGWIEAPGVTSTMYINSLVMHDTIGTKLTSWPGHGYVELLLPGPRNWTLGSFTTCTASTATADITDALNNIPPEGHTDATNHTVHHQVRTTDTLNIGPSPENLTSKGYAGHVINATATTSLFIGQASSNQRQAIGLSVCGAIDNLRLYLSKVGAPTDDLIIELWDTASDSPNASVQAIGTKAGADITTGTVAYDFTYDLFHLSAPGTRPPTKYWIVLRRTGAVDAANYFRVHGVLQTYLDGMKTWNGSVWSGILLSTRPAMRIFNRYPTARVRAMQAFAVHGKASGTGTDPGELYLRDYTSAYIAFNFADASGLVAGTFPTNWRTTKTVALEELDTTNRGLNYHPELYLRKTGSGSRVCMVCLMAVYARVTEQYVGWNRWQKTADSTFWYAKIAQSDTVAYLADGETEVTVTTGDYLLAPETAGEPDMSSLTTITEATLFAGYTQA